MVDTVTAPSTVTTPPISGALRGPGGAMGKDEFLKMLVAQLRNQDPLNPIEGQEFAAQLAQFTSVEQLMQINAAIGTQGGSQQAVLGSLNVNAALGTIGRVVTAHGDAMVATADSPAVAEFDVGGVGGGRTSIIVRDASGAIVAERDLGVMGSGRHVVSFEGDDALPPGSYGYEVRVVDGAGAAVPVQLYTTARITGVSTGANGVVLTAGGVQIPFGSIIAVRAE